MVSVQLLDACFQKGKRLLCSFTSEPTTKILQSEWDDMDFGGQNPSLNISQVNLGVRGKLQAEEEVKLSLIRAKATFLCPIGHIRDQQHNLYSWTELSGAVNYLIFSLNSQSSVVSRQKNRHSGLRFTSDRGGMDNVHVDGTIGNGDGTSVLLLRKNGSQSLRDAIFKMVEPSEWTKQEAEPAGPNQCVARLHICCLRSFCCS